ncbi:MAG: sensor histidine kinase [Lachnospiraceae bacterium]|jgi:signal transduction histidine kinase
MRKQAGTHGEVPENRRGGNPEGKQRGKPGRKQGKTAEFREIRRFRKKITIVLTVSFAAFLAVLAGALTVTYRQSGRSEIDRQLTQMIQENGENGEAPGEPAQTEEDTGREAPSEDSSADLEHSSGRLLFCREDGETDFTVLLNRNSGLSDEEAQALAARIYEAGKVSGSLENWLYRFGVKEGCLMLAVENLTWEIAAEKSYFIKIVLFTLLLLPAAGVFSFFLSGWLVRPLKEAMQKQTDFILAAGHELKTPLAVMRTSFDLMRRDGVSSRYLDYAQTENEKMTGLVAELLDLSRMESGEEQKISEDFSLSECVEGAVLPFEAAAYEKGAVLETEIEPGIRMRGDSRRIGQAAGILTDNAVHHCKKTRENEDSAHIRVTLSAEGKKAVLRVANEGDPIPEEDRERIFEKFYRAEKDRNRAEGRYGLGLPIAESIVKAHNGRIGVSCRDGWTTFTLVLPCSPVSGTREKAPD